MKLIAKKNRELALINAQNTQNENRAETIELIVPEEYESYNKKIVFITDDGVVWDVITNNEYKITNAITKYKQVNFYIWLTKEVDGESIDFRTKTKTLSFYDNEDASDEITDEEIHGVNTVVNLLEEEIEKVENLDIEATKVGNTATITITKKDGTTQSVNITDGQNGQDGKDGYTPQKGIDYFTQQDKEKIETDVKEDVLDEVYTKSETDTLLQEKADIEDIPDVSDFITKDVNNLTNYTLKTNTGSLIDLEINDTTYVVTLKLKTQDGTIISTDTIDLPLESVVVSGRYDNTTKKVILTLENGSEVDFSVADLVAGLQTEITSQNKLASDLVDDTNSGNKFVTTSEKQAWNNKLDESDLTDYVKDTDYASPSKGGVIKTSSIYKTSQYNGMLYADEISYADYENNVNRNFFIGKGTLENVIAGKQLINQTQLEESQETQDEEIEKLQTENARLKATLPTTGEVTGQDITLNKTAELEFIKPPLPMGNSEQGILPEQYQQVEYIESTGTQYINTNYTPVENDDINIEKVKNTGTGCLFSAGNSTNQLILLASSSTNYYWKYFATGNATAFFTEELSSFSTISIANGSISINNVVKASSTYAGTVDTTIQLFRRVNGESYATASIGRFTITNGNKTKLDLIPCYRISDNEVGMYDLVSNTFYTNAGTGTFNKGNSTPNPDYPQEITNVTGDVEVKVQNKNLIEGSQDFSGNWLNASLWKTDNSTYNGLVVKKRKEAWNGLKKEIEIVAGKTYTFSCYIKSDTPRKVGIYLNQGTSTTSLGSLEINTTTNWSRYSLTFTATTSGTVPPRIENTSYSDTNYTYICGYQLEECSTSTPYTPHKEQILPLTLGNIELCKIGDYQDYFYKESNKWYLHKEIKKILLNGTEYWLISNNVFYLTSISDYINSSEKICLSDKYTAINNTNVGTSAITQNNSICFFNTNTNPRLYIRDERFNNVNDFKTELSENNVKVYYPLATPTDTEITDTTLISQLEAISNAISYEEQTNISGTSDGSNPIFSVEAYQSTKLLLENFESRLTLVEG